MGSLPLTAVATDVTDTACQTPPVAWTSDGDPSVVVDPQTGLVTIQSAGGVMATITATTDELEASVDINVPAAGAGFDGLDAKGDAQFNSSNKAAVSVTALASDGCPIAFDYTQVRWEFYPPGAGPWPAHFDQVTGQSVTLDYDPPICQVITVRAKTPLNGTCGDSGVVCSNILGIEPPASTCPPI